MAGADYMVGDYRKFQQEELSQYYESPVVKATIELMDSLNLEIPKDELYGFVYPTTREMAMKYREALNKKVGSSQVPSLVVEQEKDPKTVIGSFVHRNRGITAPRVNRSNSPDEPSILRLPSYMETQSIIHSVSDLYHEGIHLFLQKGAIDNSVPEKVFQQENMPSIADALLRGLLKSADDKLEDFDIELEAAYKEAVAKGNKSIWEIYLKKLYKLPQDCCTSNPPASVPDTQ